MLEAEVCSRGAWRKMGGERQCRGAGEEQRVLGDMGSGRARQHDCYHDEVGDECGNGEVNYGGGDGFVGSLPS